jgi:hypothetical protein
MKHEERLQLISDIYHWTGLVAAEAESPWRIVNPLRGHPVAWDLCQIAGAIAGGYRIQLSPHYRGIQIIRRNRQLWKRVQQFVEIKGGQGMLPFDTGCVGEHFQAENPSFDVSAWRHKFRVPLAEWKVRLRKQQLKTGRASHTEYAEALAGLEDVMMSENAKS